MTKPWEERWFVYEPDPNKGFPAFAADISEREVRVFEAHSGEEDDRPRVRLASAAPDLVRVLLAVEWAGDDPGDSRAGDACPCCRRKSRNDHAPDCALDAALRKAGVR